MPYNLRFQTPTCLGSYSCCNNLLGILLHHPSRTAATGGCDIDILHGLRQRVAATEDGIAACTVLGDDDAGHIDPTNSHSKPQPIIQDNAADDKCGSVSQCRLLYPWNA